VTGFTGLLAGLNLRLASTPTMMSHGSARGFEKIVPLLLGAGERNVTVPLDPRGAGSGFAKVSLTYSVRIDY